MLRTTFGGHSHSGSIKTADKATSADAVVFIWWTTRWCGARSKPGLFDVEQGAFAPASVGSHSGAGPYQPYVEHDGQIIPDL